MRKEGKSNVKFFASILVLSVLMAVYVYAVGVDLSFSGAKPANRTINGSSPANINFTFIPTWNKTGETVGNCSLWTNFTGTWQSTVEFNGTNSSIHSTPNFGGNITNGSVSYINYTFPHDIGLMIWNIGCRNSTSPNTASQLNFSVANFTLLTIDTNTPKINFTGFLTNTSTPKLIFNISDINGTGINMSLDENNVTLNITLYNHPDTVALINFSLKNTSTLSCDANAQGAGVTLTTCVINLTNFGLSNGTKRVNITVTDMAGKVNSSSFTFIVDQIPPKFVYYNFTHNATHEPSDDPTGTELGSGNGNSSAQGRTIHAKVNWTDNLTYTLQGRLEFYNETSRTWQVLNYSPTGYAAGNNGSNSSWTNFSFPIPAGRNEFEGENISFRVVANDTLGNINNSASVQNFTIQVNDSYAPTVSITGTIAVNNTAISTTNLANVSWTVDENNGLAEINASVDGNVVQGGSCSLFKRYTTAVASDGVADGNRNGTTFTTAASGTGCTLGNGTHFVEVNARDAWGNTRTVFHNFTVQAGTTGVGLSFNLTSNDNSTWSRSAVDNSNITSEVGITLRATASVTGTKLSNISYTSSCDSTTVIANNNTMIYPFNGTCLTASANRTLTITLNDTSGLSNSTTLTFLVDNVGPSLSVQAPTEGATLNGLVTINLSAKDTTQHISSFVYYVDDGRFSGDFNTSNTSVTIGEVAVNLTHQGFYANFSAGLHTVRFSANDTLGNVFNSSDITFTVTGSIASQDINRSIQDYTFSVFNQNTTNATLRIKASDGSYINFGSNLSNETFQLLYLASTNSSQNYNITLTEINGSAVNWNKTSFTPFVNETTKKSGLQNNWTNTVLAEVLFNDSIYEFLPNNNSYYGVVEIPYILNSSNTSQSTVQELWWVPDLNDLSSRTNISQCTGTFTRTTSTPCFNNTASGRTRVYVPHFSIVMAVNDSTAPTINVTTPNKTQEISTFVFNITTSNDATGCTYSLNSSVANASMTKSGNICIGTETSLKNLDAVGTGVYNVTFSVNDSSGNVNTYFWRFNVSDGSAPNTPNTSRLSTSVSSTSATVTISGMNESVNATVYYGSTIGSLGSSATQTDFSQSQEVSITGLTASTVYHYNVSVCDFNGNCAQNATFNFTTGAASSSSSDSSSSSGGSSGSGGGATTSTVTDSKSQVWSSVPAGSSFSLDIDKAGVAVTSVSVGEVKAELTNVELSVAALSEKPKQIEDEPSSKVFQYLTITKKNVPDANAGSYKVGFRVTKAWLTENSLGSGDVALYRFTDSKWNELTTRVTGTDSTYVNYESDTPGFSSFAVAAKSSVAPPAAETPSGEAEEAPAAGEGAPEEVEKPVPVKAPGKAPMAWIIAAVVIIVGIALIVVYQKSKKQG